MKKKFVSLLIALTLTVSMFSFTGCNGGGNRIEIYVDGGGQQGAYNSTISMTYDPVANPYPYNTLEKVIEEYNKSQNKIEVILNDNSLNNDREKLSSQLGQKRAPEILFYLPAGIAEDMNKGWFADLDPYMNKPNPYIESGKGSEKWKDIYQQDELQGFYAPNGMLLTAPMDKAPIGITYNKVLFAAAGITEIPTYFSEFMAAQDKLQTYFESIGKNNNQVPAPVDSMTPYFPTYTWFDIVLESAIFANKLDVLDVLRKDGRVDAEEFCRGYKKPTPENPTYFIKNGDQYNDDMMAYIDSVLEITKYYPKGYEGYYAEQEFLQGRVGMIEAHSGTMMKINSDKGKDFEIGTFPYPILDKDVTMGGKTYTDINAGGFYTRRGLAGLTTGWGVTNSAIDKGQEVVDACADFLMFCTAPNQNDRIVNDLGFSVPLSGNSTNPIYAGLVSKYDEDIQNEKATSWGAVNSWGALGKGYMDTFLNNRKTLISSKFSSNFNREKSVKTMLDTLNDGFANAYLKTMRENGFNSSNW